MPLINSCMTLFITKTQKCLFFFFLSFSSVMRPKTCVNQQSFAIVGAIYGKKKPIGIFNMVFMLKWYHPSNACSHSKQ